MYEASRRQQHSNDDAPGEIAPNVGALDRAPAGW